MDAFNTKLKFSKASVIVQVQEKEDEDAQSASDTSSELAQRAWIIASRYARCPPRPSLWTKFQEGARFTCIRYQVAMKDLRDPKDYARPVSKSGKFNHRYVTPLFTQQGKNDRIVLGGQYASKVNIRDIRGTTQDVIQAASHNYAGLYGRYMDIHHFALDRLPVVISPAIQIMEDSMNRAIADHFGVDFCANTSTGYGSNLLALSAILDHDWAVIVDEKSHNSIFVAAYQSRPGSIRKFRHNDMDHLKAVLDESSASYIHMLVVIEGFSSMDGTLPDLAGLSELKARYNFTLLADEAHSFLCLGGNGQGCVELWNERNPACSVLNDLIDLRTGTLSKAVGAIGGLVCGKEQYRTRVVRRQHEMLQAGYEPITTAACVQTIHALHQLNLVQRNLKRLNAMAIFCRQNLRQAGIFVYGDDDSPILPVFAGRPSSAAKLSYVLRKLGVLASPVSTPAVPFWESRVRVCLSAAFDDNTVCDLLDAIVKAAQSLGLCNRNVSSTVRFHHDEMVDAETEAREAADSRRHIHDLVIQSAAGAAAVEFNHSTLEVGKKAFDQYGLGSGGARWITGTTDVHVRVERLVTRVLGQPEALTYPDTYVGLTSTIAALCRPADGFNRHDFYIPETAAPAVDDGVRVAPKKGRPTVRRYSDLESLAEQLHAQKRSNYATILIRSKDVPTLSVVESFMVQLSHFSKTAGITVLLHDEAGFGSFKPLRNLAQFTKMRLLIYGSFHRAFRLPGSYLAGDAALIKELRYTSRGYMFSTSQQPFVMAMIAAELEHLSCDGVEQV